jgi:mannose-1-phosphate guanylyltransferase
MTMMTFDTDLPESSGIVEVDNDGIVTRFHEKVRRPPGKRANAAVYIFEPEVAVYIASLGKPIVDLSTEVIPSFVGRIATFHNDVFHRDIGSPESLRIAERDYRPMHS